MKVSNLAEGVERSGKGRLYSDSKYFEVQTEEADTRSSTQMMREMLECEFGSEAMVDRCIKRIREFGNDIF